jgi:osmotically-inducible protein OsmY
MEIAETAETRLRKNSFLALRNVSCSFVDGMLTLRGCLPSYYLKQVAQEIAGGVPGVAGIINQIEVVSFPSCDPGSDRLALWPKSR